MGRFKKGVRLTLKEVKRRLSEIRTDIEIIDNEYVNAKTGLKCKCKNCGHIWKPTWDNLRVGKGCPKCLVDSLKTPHNKFVEDIKAINSGIEIKSKYENMKSMILCRCNIDGTEFKIRADSLTAGFGCPTCSIKARSKSHDEFIREMQSVNDYIKITGEYINKRTKVECTCGRCGHIWEALPNNLLEGSNCPNCSIPMSTGEKLVEEYLINKNIEYKKEHTFNNCKNDIVLRFDFYLPNANVCIEYDGEQHFRPIEYFGGVEKFKKVKENDSIKNKYCKNNNIKLIRIPYTTDNVEDFLNERLSSTY